MSTTYEDEDLDLTYEADLLGNIQQVLAGLQGFGSMALELLQNADDAGATRISFDVRNDRLIVRHNSVFSSCGLRHKRCPWLDTGDPKGNMRPCDFHAISRMAARGKVGEDLIGRFGIGFVSVYQVTDAPIIRSNGVELRLDPLTRRNRRLFVETGDETTIELPWAQHQSATRRELKASPVPSDIATKMVAALREVSAEGLLFLRGLREVRIARSGSEVGSTILSRDGAMITVKTDGAPDVRWLTVEADAAAAAGELAERFEVLKELRRQTVVRVAFRLDGEASWTGKLYAFLPTGESSQLPCHINADFFPRQDRRSIVLTGEQHDRYFNEMLLHTAAAALGGRLGELKFDIGHQRLWALMEAAARLDGSGSAFETFWEQLAEGAGREPIAFTNEAAWKDVSECVWPPAHFSPEEEAAASTIGLPIVDGSLRAHRNVFLKLGTEPLDLEGFTAAMEATPILQSPEYQDEDEPQPDGALLACLWSAAQKLLAAERGSGKGDLAERLSAVSFLLDIDGDRLSIDEAYRPPEFTSAEAIRKFVGAGPFVSEGIKAFPDLYGLIDTIGTPALAHCLAAEIATEDDALAKFSDAKHLSGLFDLLGSFTPNDQDRLVTRQHLAATPILPSADGFLTPERALWPGGFHDPIGHFRLVEGTFTPGGEAFVREVLRVPTLTFKAYLEEHLDGILGPDLTRAQYQALITEVLRNEYQLAADGGFGALRQARLVRTTKGNFVRAPEAYLRTDETEALLGRDADTWVDLSWLPVGPDQERTLGLFGRLGLDAMVSVRHLIERVEELTSSPPDDRRRAAIALIVRNLLDRFPRLNPAELKELEELSHKAWLPGSLLGKPVEGVWHRPRDIQRPFGSEAFSSQLPFIDIAALRASRSAQPFLDLLGVPAEPPTTAVVAHLIHCAEEGTAPNDTVYGVLFQRRERGDVVPLERLRDVACIYDPDRGRFLLPTDVFWNPPPLRTHWSRASKAMRQREALFSFLGVEDDPGPRHYGQLLRRIVEDNPAGLAGDPTEALVHERCLASLATALTSADPIAAEALQDLFELPFLLRMDGAFARKEAVVWADAPALLEPFGRDIDGLITAPPVAERTAVSVLYRFLAIPPLSAVVRLRVVSAVNPRQDEKAEAVLSDRASLLLWLAVAPELRGRLARALEGIQVYRVDELLQAAELNPGGTPIPSPPQAVDAFFDAEEGRLLVRCSDSDEIDWSAAFSALVTALQAGLEIPDLPHLVVNATYVITASSAAGAERSLRRAGFRPLSAEAEPIEESRELGDLEAGVDDEVLWAAGPPDEAGAAQATEGNDDEASADDGDLDEDELDDEEAGWDEEDEEENDDDLEPGRTRDGKDANSFNAPRGGGQGGSGSRAESDTGSDTGHHDPLNPAQPRNHRLLSYVAHGKSSSSGTSSEGGAGGSNPIDERAMAAAMAYEVKAGRIPERQSQTNPGFDIISLDPATGAKRLIEVKGVLNEWNDRGVKLTKTQFATAQQHGDAFWIYVVEHATDASKQTLTALQSPFAKVEEFWFDSGWREVSEHAAAGRDVLLTAGRKVRHADFGEGVIEKATKRGLIWDLVISFRHNGVKSLMFNKAIQLLDD